jgi:hypothetical protein
MLVIYLIYVHESSGGTVGWLGLNFSLLQSQGFFPLSTMSRQAVRDKNAFTDTDADIQ